MGYNKSNVENGIFNEKYFLLHTTHMYVMYVQQQILHRHTTIIAKSLCVFNILENVIE